jgi:hypothetical protein
MFPHRSIGPHNDWDKFRPARDLRTARRKQRRIPVALILATALLLAFLLADQLRPRVEAALAYVAKVALGPKREEVPLRRQSDSEKPSARPYQTHYRRDPRFSRTELGPFDAYVLDGSRYIRVEGKDSYALVDTKTGKVTWINKARKYRESNPPENAATADAKPRETH